MIIDKKETIDELNEETKKQIDEMGYESMLRLNRFAPSGHYMFMGKTGKYFIKVMNEKREKIGNDEHVKASKRIGWEG